MAEIEYLSRENAAEYLSAKCGVPIRPQTLARYAVDGSGPRFMCIGRRVTYRVTDLDAWLAERELLSVQRSVTQKRARKGGNVTRAELAAFVQAYLSANPTGALADRAEALMCRVHTEGFL